MAKNVEEIEIRDLCDRCGKEIMMSKDANIAYQSLRTLYNFDDDGMEMPTKIKLTEKNGKVTNILIAKRVNIPNLCQKCLVDYNKLITQTNKEIDIFLKSK